MPYYDYAFYNDGEKLALLQRVATSTYDPAPAITEDYLTPQADDAQGVMIEYTSDKDYPTDELSNLDVSRQLALAIVDYVKYRLLEDSNPRESDRYYGKFLRRVSRSESNKDGQPAIIIPSGVGALK